MIIFAIILIITCTVLLAAACACLLWNKPKSVKPVKNADNEKFSRDMRETQVLDESMITTELSDEDIIEFDKIKLDNVKK